MYLSGYQQCYSNNNNKCKYCTLVRLNDPFIKSLKRDFQHSFLTSKLYVLNQEIKKSKILWTLENLSRLFILVFISQRRKRWRRKKINKNLLLKTLHQEFLHVQLFVFLTRQLVQSVTMAHYRGQMVRGALFYLRVIFVMIPVTALMGCRM